MIMSEEEDEKDRNKAKVFVQVPRPLAAWLFVENDYF